MLSLCRIPKSSLAWPSIFILCPGLCVQSWCAFSMVSRCPVSRPFPFRRREEKGGLGTAEGWKCKAQTEFECRRSQLSMEQSCCTDLKRLDRYSVHVFFFKCVCGVKGIASMYFAGGKPCSFCCWLRGRLCPEYSSLSGWSRCWYMLMLSHFHMWTVDICWCLESSNRYTKWTSFSHCDPSPMDASRLLDFHGCLAASLISQMQQLFPDRLDMVRHPEVIQSIIGNYKKNEGRWVCLKIGYLHH